MVVVSNSVVVSNCVVVSNEVAAFVVVPVVVVGISDSAVHIKENPLTSKYLSNFNVVNYALST